MNSAIEVNNLSKRFMLTTESQTLFRLFKRVTTGKSYFKELWALKDINFKVEKGKRVGIIGNNGSGKTTLLRIIMGIYKQTRGTIKINGKVSGFLYLGTGLQRDLSVLDNIYLFGAIMGFDRRQIHKKLDSIIDFSESGDYIHTALRDLPMGMHQRLAFSIAKEAHLEILILDEMLVSGDVGFREKCFAIFEKYKADDKTIIMVSHDMELVKKFCEKALLLDKGNQIAFGPTEEIVDIYLKKYAK